MRPQDAALAERGLDVFVRQAGGAQTERPPGARIVLRLNRAKPGDDICWTFEVRSRQLLTVQAPPQYSVRGYRFAASNASTSFDER